MDHNVAELNLMSQFWPINAAIGCAHPGISVPKGAHRMQHVPSVSAEYGSLAAIEEMTQLMIAMRFLLLEVSTPHDFRPNHDKVCALVSKIN